MKNLKPMAAVITAMALTLSMSVCAMAEVPPIEGDLKVVPFSSIPGIKVGNVTDLVNGTGCTVIIAEDPNGAIGGVDVRGGSPGTRETDLLDPTKTVQTVNAVVLSGGSAFGLEAADGVMKFLEEKGMGVDVGPTVVPIVPSAILFDIGFGNAFVRPDKEDGYQACVNAFQNMEWKDGNTGAGTGATVGKGASAIGATSMKGGLGSFAYKYGDLYVGAIVAVNAAGNIVDPETGNIVAGARVAGTNSFVDMEQYTMNGRYDPPKSVENTTIALIVTNANLTQSQTKKLAEMAHDGFARAIYPVHTASDGDTIFAMALGGVESQASTWNKVDVNMNLLGVLAVNAMESAIVSAGENAETLLGVTGAASLETQPTQPSASPLK